MRLYDLEQLEQLAFATNPDVMFKSDNEQHMILLREAVDFILTNRERVENYEAISAEVEQVAEKFNGMMDELEGLRNSVHALAKVADALIDTRDCL